MFTKEHVHKMMAQSKIKKKKENVPKRKLKATKKAKHMEKEQ